MKKRLLWAFTALLLLCPGVLVQGEELSEWTFMMYMCGTDLESVYGMGSYNLGEITSLWFPEQVVVGTGDGVETVDWQADGVNLLVETGGARVWHGMEEDVDGNTLGVDIATDRLQRYIFDLAYSEEDFGYMRYIPVIMMTAKNRITTYQVIT